MIIPFLLKHKMHMCRPIPMPLKLLQQLSDRSIVGDRIRHGDDSLEPEDALRIARHDRALIRPFAPGILHIVEAVGVRLPDVDLDAFDGLAGRVFQGAEDEAGFAVRVVGDGGAVCLRLRFVRVERS